MFYSILNLIAILPAEPPAHRQLSSGGWPIQRQTPLHIKVKEGNCVSVHRIGSNPQQP
jgi:hypothetical protein